MCHLTMQVDALENDTYGQIEYMARFIEEEGLERDEKVEGVKGMLEGVVEGVSSATSPVLNPRASFQLKESTKRWEERWTNGPAWSRRPRS